MLSTSKAHNQSRNGMHPLSSFRENINIMLLLFRSCHPFSNQSIEVNSVPFDLLLKPSFSLVSFLGLFNDTQSQQTPGQIHGIDFNI
jgi:hypothetical protein